MELLVTVEEWPGPCELAPGAEVTWAGGKVRGPRVLPGVFG